MNGLIEDMGIMSYVYLNYSAEQMAETIERQGLKSVQLDPRQSGFLGQESLSRSAAEKAYKAFSTREIRIVGLSDYLGINLMDPDPERREASIRHLEQTFEFAEIFNTQYVAAETGSLHPSNSWAYHPENDSESAFSSLLRTIERIRTTATKYNCVFLMEGYVNNVLYSPERAERVLKELGHDGLGVVLDPFNYMTKEDLDNQEQALGNIFRRLSKSSPIAHAKDAVYDDRGFHTPRAGTGKMDWKIVSSMFLKYTPDTPLILEHVEPDLVHSCIEFITSHFKDSSC